MSKQSVVVLSDKQIACFQLLLVGMADRASKVFNEAKTKKEKHGLKNTLRFVVHAMQTLEAGVISDWLPKPTHNGEWAYCPKGRSCAKSVVFVSGVTPKDKGFVLAISKASRCASSPAPGSG